MGNMSFFSDNLINTTTQLVVSSNTGTTEYLFDKNTLIGWESFGYTSDTSSVVSVEFGTNTVISDIFIQNHNFKDFRIFYNSVTANSIYTATSSSVTSNYISLSPTTISSLQIQVDATQDDTERYLGELVVCEKTITLSRNPSFKQYKPKVYRKQIRHEMADGGVSVFNVRDRYRAAMSFDYIDTTTYGTIRDIFDAGTSFYFSPFPTSTAWDGNAYNVLWTGDFVFTHSTNDKQQGFSGSINLEEVSSQ